MNNENQHNFPPTAWSQLQTLEHDEAAYSEFIGQYWSPVYAFLRRSGHNRDAAAELTQAFFVEVVIGRKLFERADRTRGRFRTLMLSCLQNFVISATRHPRHAVFEHPREMRLDPLLLDAAEPTPNTDPQTAFNRQWARQLLREVTQRVRTRCMESGMELHWRAYELRVLQPMLYAVDTPSVQHITDEIGARDAAQTSHMIQSVKRQAESTLRALVSQTLKNPEDLDMELSNLSIYFEDRL